jgi:adenine-specific DNA glycosylase
MKIGPCAETINASGKIFVCVPQRKMSLQSPSDWNPQRLLKRLTDLQYAPDVMKFKKLGAIWKEATKAITENDPKKFRKHIRKIQKGIRDVCRQKDSLCAETPISPVFAQYTDLQLLGIIQQDIPRYVLQPKSKDTIDVYRTDDLLVEIRNGAELLASRFERP